MMNRSYLTLLPEFVIAASIIYSYAQKLLLMLQGQPVQTVTGMDTFVIELVSAVLCLTAIAFGFIVIKSKRLPIGKTIGSVLIWVLLISVTAFVLITSAGNAFLNTALLYTLAGSTLLKLWIFYKNKADFLNPIGYVFIYAGCFAVATLIELHIFDIASLSQNSNLSVSERFAFSDTVSAIIFYFVIGFIIPTITFVRHGKNFRNTHG